MRAVGTKLDKDIAKIYLDSVSVAKDPVAAAVLTLVHLLRGGLVIDMAGPDGNLGLAHEIATGIREGLFGSGAHYSIDIRDNANIHVTITQEE